MILIATCEIDPTADYVTTKMTKRQINHRRVSLDAVRTKGGFSFNPKNGDWSINDGVSLTNSQEVTSIWHRRIPRRKIGHSDNHVSDYLTQEWRFVWEWWISLFPTEKILDPQLVIRTASNKMLQLSLARKIGFITPDTIITSTPKDFLDLVQSHESVVVKTLAGFGCILEENKSFGTIYTHRIDKTKPLDEPSIQAAPVILQEEIHKMYELRVTVVEDQIFSCRIDSQNSQKTQVDWRRYDFKNVPHQIEECPQEIQQKMFQMMKFFGVHFASFDLAVTPEGAYIFFEMNPNSQWVWIEHLTGLPITDALIDALVLRQKS